MGFNIIDQMLAKETLPILEMLKGHKIVKITKKGNQFWDITLKRASEFHDLCILWKPAACKLMIDSKKQPILSLYPTKKGILLGFCQS